MRAAFALLLLLIGGAWSAELDADGLAPLFVRPLSSSSAAVDMGALSYLLDHSADGSITFGAHRKASVELSGLPAEAMAIHVGEVGPGEQNEEFVVLWSEDSHFPRLLLNATTLTSLQILCGGSHDTLIVHHVPSVFKAHLEIDTGEGNDSLVMDHSLDSGHSLTLRSGGSVSIRKALSACPVGIASGGNVAVTAACACTGPDQISIEAATLDVNADLSTEEGALALEGQDGININGATVATGTGTLRITGIASTGAGITIAGAMVRSNGGDVIISATGPSAGLVVSSTDFVLAGAANMVVVATASPDTAGIAFGARFATTTFSTSSYVVAMNVQVNSLSGSASDSCIGLEISNSLISSLGTWDLDIDNFCDVAAFNVGAQFHTVTMDYQLGSFRIDASSVNLPAEGTIGLSLTSIVGSLPSFHASGTAISNNPFHGLVLDSVNTFIGDAFLSGNFQSVSGSALSATSIVSSDLIVGGSLQLFGLAPPFPGMQASGVVLDLTAIRAASIELNGTGIALDATSVCGVCLSASSLTSFGDTIILGNMHAFENDFGVNIDASSTIDSVRFQITGVVEQSPNTGSVGVLLAGSLSASGDSSITGSISANVDGSGILIVGGSLVSTASVANFLFEGTTGATNPSGAGAHLVDFEFLGTDSPSETLSVIGSTSSTSPADCIRIEGSTTLDGFASFQTGTVAYRPTRGHGIVVTDTVTSSSMRGITILGIAAVSPTTDPTLCIGVTFFGVVTSLQTVFVRGVGPIGVQVEGSVTSLEGSVTIDGTADSSSLGTGERFGANTGSSSLISAPAGSVTLTGTSNTHSGSILMGDITAGGDVTLRGVGTEDLDTSGLSVEGSVVADLLTMEGFGSGGLGLLGVIVASSVMAQGTSASTVPDRIAVGVVAGGSITTSGTVSITGSAITVEPTSFAVGVVALTDFELFPPTAAGGVDITGVASGGNDAVGLFWRANVFANRDISLVGTVSNAANSGIGVSCFGDGSIVAGTGSLFLFGTGTGTAEAVGIEGMGIFSSDTAVRIDGDLFAPAFGSGVRLGDLTRQADFTGTGEVEIIGDARDSNGGTGVHIRSDVTFGAEVHIHGTGGCITGLDDNPGVVVGGTITSVGTLELEGAGCSFGSSGNHGIVIAAGEGISSGSSCSLGGRGEAMEGNNVGILFEAGTGDETLVTCDSIFIEATEMSEGDAGYTGTSFLHPTVMTSAVGVSILTTGFVGMSIDADVTFVGGDVYVSSVGASVATAVGDGVVMTFDGPRAVLLQSSDSFFLGVAVQIVSDALFFVIEGGISGDSLIFVGPSTDLMITELTLSRCEFTMSSVSLQAFDARAVFCGDVILNGFDVVSSESIALQCGGTLSSSLDIGFLVDTFSMDTSYSIEGPVNVLINAATEANFAGDIGLLEPVASLTVQSSGYVRLSSTYISQGMLTVAAASLELGTATFEATEISMGAAEVQGSNPSLTAEGGLITLRSLGEFGASPRLTSASADMDVQFFTGTIRALQSTALSLGTSLPSSGTVELNQFSALMPFGAFPGCMTVDKLHMNDDSLLMVDVARSTVSGACNTDQITVSTEVVLQGEAEVVFNTSFDPLVRGESYTFIDSPLTTNVFANPPTMAGGFAATVVYGGTTSASRAVLGAGDVSLVINQLPVTVADSYSTTSTAVLAVPAPGVLLNDFDPDMTSLTVVEVTSPTFGLLATSPDGSFSWDPQGMVGLATFLYVASDGMESSPQTTVTLLSTAVVPSPPPGPTVPIGASPSPTNVATPTVTTVLTFSRTPTPSPLVSAELVGPTPVPASPAPMPSPSRSYSGPPSVIYVQGDDDDDSTEDGPVTTTVLVPDGDPVVVFDPETGEPIATIDVVDPMGGTLVVVVLPADERDVVSNVLDIQFFIDGQPVTSFEDGIEICFPARDDDDACLGFYNSSGDWECEDYCLDVDDENNSACGVTHHLTNFALLLDGDANSESKCGSVDNDYVILYISAAMGGCCCLFVGISVVVIEIKIRRKKFKVAQELDSLARQTRHAQSL